jgi:hypothetical protein
MWVSLRRGKLNLCTITYVHKAKINKIMINQFKQKSWYLYKDFDISDIYNFSSFINLLGLAHNAQVVRKPMSERNAK